MENEFYYDILVNEENLCNLNREKKLLWKFIEEKKKIVVYGPRNCGKTSLVKNVIIPKFKRKYKKSFILFCDLMEVKNLDSIQQRLKISLENSFVESFPARRLLQSAKEFLTKLRPQIEMDPQSGQPSLTLKLDDSKPGLSFEKIFTTLKQEIFPKLPCLLVFDEFQDIALIAEAQAYFRQAFQEINSVPIVLMGSKKHLLADLVAKPNAPLAFFGEDLEFHPIPYEEYYEYILERFKNRKLKISFEDCRGLQDHLFRNPEAINIVGAQIKDTFKDRTLTKKEIFNCVYQVVKNRRSRYEEYLSHFSDKEEAVLIALASQVYVSQPTGKEFRGLVSSSPRTLNQTFKRFLDKAIIEKTPEGYRLSDPLLQHFLREFR